MLKIITKLIEFAERHTKNEGKRKLYRTLLTEIDRYVFKTTGTATLRRWRYFVLDKDWVDKVKNIDNSVGQVINIKEETNDRI